MTVGELIVRFGADLGPLQKGIKDMQRALKPMQDNLRALGKGLSTYVTAPAVGAVAAMTGLAHQAANYADEIDKTAIRTGLATDTLQELRFAADQTGVGFGSIQRSVEGLTRRLTQVDEGSGRAAEAMAKLGIRTRDADGEMRRMDELFPDVIARLQSMENETERNALALEVFGRSAGQLTPLLAAGEQGLEDLRQKARDLGLVMSGDSIKSLVEFKDEWAAAMQQVKMAGMELGARFMPILRDDLIPFIQNTVVPALGDFVDRIGDLIDVYRALSPGVKTAVNVVAGFAVALGPVLLAVATLSMALPGLAAAFAVLTSPITLTIGALAAIGATIAYMIDNLDSLKTNWKIAWDTIKHDTFAAIDAILEKIESVVAIFRPQYKRLVADARSALQEGMAGIDLSAPQAEFKTLADYITAVKEEVQSLIGGTTVTRDSIIPGVEETNADLMALHGTLSRIDAIAEAFSGRDPLGPMQQRAAALTAFLEDAYAGEIEIPTTTIEKYRAELDALNQQIGEVLGQRSKLEGMRTEGSDDDFLPGLNDASVALEGVNKKLDLAKVRLFDVREMGVGVATMFSDQMAHGIGRIVEGVLLMEDGFRSMRDVMAEFGRTAHRVIAQVVADMAAAIAKAAIFKGIMSVLGIGGAGSIGSLFGQALGFGGFRAEGGPVDMGRTYLVGERGPELFTPSRSGAIVPNHALAGGGAQSVHATFSPLRLEGDHVMALVERVITRQIDEGNPGVLARAVQRARG